eukprot:TRINITY_DN3038_c0_g1_i2.p1 TRINITY_DN3038_c0_g1~~TRINITY_DN3038_c0_g1_i2.p1  ORF type:complete len:167 (-),score=25.01 TRINITY_DN3038_c0_g1_i2:100-600(-)
MLTRTLKAASKLHPLLSSGIPLSSSEHFDTIRPKGRVKVTDKIIWLNVIPDGGEVRRIPSFPGEVLVDVLMKYHIPNIRKDCGGGDPIFPVKDAPVDYFSSGPVCEGCHVIVHEKWFEKMYVSYIERGRLASLGLTTSKTSRFSCCILIKEYMNDMLLFVQGQPGR